jgi:protein gp37
MSTKTGIEWTDSTWNPIRGCSRVSEGCRNCYAEKVAYRFSGEGQPYAGLAVLKNGHASWTGKVEFVEKHLLDPLKWGPVAEHVAGCRIVFLAAHISAFKPRKCDCPVRRRRIFVNSMSDLFHENVPDEWIDRIFAVMALCPQHDFQVLTKRPARMLKYFSAGEGDLMERWGFWASHALHCHTGVNDLERDKSKAPSWPLPNVWLGVSVENQAAADERIPLLLQTPAAVRFISAEPLLGPVQLLWQDGWGGKDEPPLTGAEPAGDQLNSAHHIRHGASRLDWVIVGGESGAGAESRQMKQAWVRSLRDQCATASVPFFFKQWGQWVPTDDPKIAQERGVPFDGCMSWMPRKKMAGSLLDGVEHKAFPAVHS